MQPAVIDHSSSCTVGHTSTGKKTWSSGAPQKRRSPDDSGVLGFPSFFNSFVLYTFTQTLCLSHTLSLAMGLQHSIAQWSLVLLLLCLGLADAHTIITYPGYRGNNLHTNGTIQAANGLGVAYDPKNGTLMYPYGMEWIYPCKGIFFLLLLAFERKSSIIH